MRNISLIKAILVGFFAAMPYVATDETLGKSVLTKIGAVKAPMLRVLSMNKPTSLYPFQALLPSRTTTVTPG